MPIAPSAEESLKMLLLILKHGSYETDFEKVAADMGLAGASAVRQRLAKLMAKAGCKPAKVVAEGHQARERLGITRSNSRTLLERKPKKCGEKGVTSSTQPKDGSGDE